MKNMVSGPQKTAIVTGASQGIGAGIVKGFVERGFNVVANSRKVTQSTEVAASDQVAPQIGQQQQAEQQPNTVAQERSLPSETPAAESASRAAMWNAVRASSWSQVAAMRKRMPSRSADTISTLGSEPTLLATFASKVRTSVTDEPACT